MSNWWEQGYPGGPMVAVKGFPRPLYPPDNPKPNPVDGSDVEAYKRTVSRLGRWEWQAFDQAYSNSFAHGKSGGNVGESGIEGFQRQQGIQPTGNIGEETFNALRSARIPEGLPNAGERGMDARSVELINAASARFGGKEPTGATSTSAKARLARAITQIGIKESPTNSNRCKYTDWYGMIGPWCAMFATWCDLTGPNPSTGTFSRGRRYAYCPYVVSDARMGYHGLSITSSPKPGDLVVYDWRRDGEFDHIGIFEKGDSSAWSAIEGNTSTSNNSNGGQVMRRSRRRTDASIVFVRVEEP